MPSNIEKYRQDLEKLIGEGDMLEIGMSVDCYPDEMKKQFQEIAKKNGEKLEEVNKRVPSFKDNYQKWYSEALVLVKLLIPDRLEDLKRLFERPKNRKEITYENYTIEDYLVGLQVTRGYDGKVLVDEKAARPRFKQQLAILKSAKKRFESTLFDIRQLVQADIFDSELDVALELNKKGFVRAAGAVAGVVLEAHLSEVVGSHGIKGAKKEPTISELNDLLKNNDIIETSVWRFIQHLGDLRNKCDHKKKDEPSSEEIKELIEGVGKVVKTVF